MHLARRPASGEIESHIHFVRDFQSHVICHTQYDDSTMCGTAIIVLSITMCSITLLTPIIRTFPFPPVQKNNSFKITRNDTTPKIVF